MIKRILFLSLLVCLTVPVFAQYNGPHCLVRHVSPNVFSGLTNTIKRLLTREPDNRWITAIKQTSANAQIPHGYLGIRNVFTPEAEKVEENLSPAQQNFVLRSFVHLSHTLKHQEYYQFYNYQLVVPRESDLLKLSNEDIRCLQRFLKQPLAASKVSNEFKNVRVELHKNHIVKVSLPNEIYLFFDCFRKNVYLVYKTLNIPNLPSKDTVPEKVYNL